MKNIIKILAVASTIIVSCSEEFIELIPESTITVDYLYKTDKDFQDAIIGCYDVFQSQYQSFWVFGDLRADDVYQDNPLFTSNVRTDNYTLDESDGLLNSTWRNYYRAIFRINTVLAQIDKFDIAVVTKKDRHIGEAKFLRALAYFDLVRIFGDVPMLLKPINIEEGYTIPREKVDKIYDEIIVPDLLDAESKLPATYAGSDIGRVTKGAAKALLGKVYLTRNDFVKAESKLQEVTTMGYALIPNFKDLFDYSKNEHHSEYIFDIEYEEGINEGSSITNQCTPNSQAIAKVFGVIGDLGESGHPTTNIFSVFEANDLRKDVSVVKGGVFDAAGKWIALGPNIMWAFTRKYMVPLKANNDSKANWKVIRYADVLLMYAEALNENNKTTEAIGYLNQVRKRANVTEYTSMTKDDTREKIYLERRLELYMEGHRWFDLLRTSRALSVMEAYGMKSHMTVFPIPLSQMQLINDETILWQNEGY